MTSRAGDYARSLLKLCASLRAQRNQARADARVLAHAYMTDTRPPPDVVERALGKDR